MMQFKVKHALYIALVSLITLVLSGYIVYDKLTITESEVVSAMKSKYGVDVVVLTSGGQAPYNVEFLSNRYVLEDKATQMQFDVYISKDTFPRMFDTYRDKLLEEEYKKELETRVELLKSRGFDDPYGIPLTVAHYSSEGQEYEEPHIIYSLMYRGFVDYLRATEEDYQAVWWLIQELKTFTEGVFTLNLDAYQLVDEETDKVEVDSAEAVLDELFGSGRALTGSLVIPNAGSIGSFEEFMGLIEQSKPEEDEVKE